MASIPVLTLIIVVLVEGVIRTSSVWVIVSVVVNSVSTSHVVVLI